MREFMLTASNARIRRASTVVDPDHVETRLKELHPDLTTSLLRDAILGGLSNRNSTTSASAPTAAGVQQWLKTVEDLRTLLMLLQWQPHQQQNCPFISSPDRSLSIVVMTGNSETGKDGVEDPTNQAEKGAVAEGFAKSNRQLELFNQEAFKLASDHQAATQVWVLLYVYDKALHEVRYELSFPIGFNKKRITEWGERLILGSIPNNPADFNVHKDEPNSPATVQVEPKSGIF